MQRPKVWAELAYVAMMPLAVCAVVNWRHWPEFWPPLKDPAAPAWVQAIGAIVAILAGFAGILFQEWRRSREARDKKIELAGVAGKIARNALVHVVSRLEPIIPPRKILYEIRGYRTAEAVSALREFGAREIPIDVVEPLVNVRGALHAITSRIDDVFEIEQRQPAAKAKRKARLESAGRVLHAALREYEALRSILSLKYRISIERVDVPDHVNTFMQEALEQTVSGQDSNDSAN